MDGLDLKLTRIAHKTSNPINLTTMDTLPPSNPNVASTTSGR